MPPATEWKVPGDPDLREHLLAMLKPGSFVPPPLGKFEGRIRPIDEADLLIVQCTDGLEEI